MQLVIDIGNTSIKIGLFEKDTLRIHATFEYVDFKHEISQIIQKYNIKSGIVSSVGKLNDIEKQWLSDTLAVLVLNQETKVPFVNRYETPHTLGVDRIALAAAASTIFPEQNVLIIDAGTCITYDFLDRNIAYWGGAISPGIHSRYKALHDYTAKLPLLEKQIPENYLGNNTQNSIHSGVVNGTLQEIEGVINQYSTDYKKLTVVLTGGDAEFLAKQLKSSIFVRPFFLLEGLFTILKLNTNDKKD
jgi:type III pantothenate kinase